MWLTWFYPQLSKPQLTNSDIDHIVHINPITSSCQGFAVISDIIQCIYNSIFHVGPKFVPGSRLQRKTERLENLSVICESSNG